ncbi:RNA-directed DNA polymerase (reverse transcriptase)-related family protein [Rhynchospora pubera]|uniref:RNA-directed DNA polymerase (Reverse transcriptase)-related family protein n=1 Tax=Rhynchospora pubera TaxID=906938 RepID=A0AAV8HFJ6_9POAL|nr:RNA-directed DNA polymerase (reverse transcriptase)-related family protein [Rhynchospora pubera]
MTINVNFKILTWNVRGLNDLDKRLAVRQTILLERPAIVCLQETKWDAPTNSLVYQSCGFRFANFQTIDSIGTRGGVLLAWDGRIFSLLNSQATQHLLSVDLELNKDGSRLRLTAVYGPSTSETRPAFLHSLQAATPVSGTPWLLCGDFNVTISPTERTNSSYGIQDSELFRDTLCNLQLIDLPLSDRNYTWSNMRPSPSMAKLDRILINHSFSTLFPNSCLQSLANTSSDHIPILCSVRTNFKRSNLFRFENFLLRVPALQDLVLNLWFSNPTATSPNHLNEKLNLLATEITAWSKHRQTSLKIQLSFIRQFLSRCDRAAETRNLSELETWLKAMLKRRFTELSVLEELYWRQRAKVKWRVEGDRNTSYFHAKASHNKRTSSIQSIKFRGNLVTDQASKGRAFFDYFISLMGTQSEPLPDLNWSNLYRHQQPLPLYLAEPISQQEVIEVINSWPSGKSPGPDGFTGEFFKHFALELAPDFTFALNSALQSGSLSPLNGSLIVLIPKHDNPTEPKDFRPISIVHSAQRILSKILANRIMPHLPALVHQSQTGFLKGRHITENFLYAQHLIRHSTTNNIPLAIFKADIHKAFDTISWEFVLKILAAMAFPTSWISWVATCVLQGSSRVIVNGLAGRFINLKRGVRQGDPLSPYLFILAMDYLSRWMVKLHQNGLPLSNKKLKREDYVNLLQRFKLKLDTWSSSMLSMAGRLTLINSCLSSLPVYFMSVFRLPKWVIHDIDTIRRTFLWQGSSTHARKLITVAWDKVCTPKQVGGLGVSDINTFNLTLLAKWLWKWHHQSFSPWKHLVVNLLTEPTIFPSHSPLCSTFQELLPAFRVITYFKISSGKSASFWLHNWGLGILCYSYSDLYSYCIDQHLLVSTFLANWNDIFGLFRPSLLASTSACQHLTSLLQTISSFLSVTTTQESQQPDQLHCTLKNDSFTSAAFYKFLKLLPQIPSRLKYIWKLKVPPRVKTFIWLLLQNKLATIDNLQRRGMTLVNRCSLCQIECESVFHISNSCSFFSATLQLVFNLASIPLITFSSTEAALISKEMTTTSQQLLAITCYYLWRERCSRIFRDVTSPASVLANQVIEEWTFFQVH